LMLLLIIIVFQPPFVLFGGIFLVFFNKKYWLKTPFSSLFIRFGSIRIYVPYDCFSGRYHSIAVDFLGFKP
jgi:hypothetical protein